MTEHQDSIWNLVSFWFWSNWKPIAAWLGTLTLSQIQTVVGILSGCAMLVYTIVNTVKLWRELRRGGS